MRKYDYLIIGAGIMGLALARRIRQSLPNATIGIMDKEEEIGLHASSRNSGVLHAGFYYSADSLKAKLCVDGNRAMKDFCRQHRLKLNETGKLVVAKNDDEVGMLNELKSRGDRNGAFVELLNTKQAEEIEPNIQTYKKALYSPDTASVDPKEVCLTLKDVLSKKGIDFHLNTRYVARQNGVVETSKENFEASRVINCGGLYADKIAKDFGFAQSYTIIPFKGLYLKYTKNTTDVSMNIYPVPNLKNPFLGVHFTKTVDNEIKIGPTAMPAFWRENYKGMSKFRLNEFCSILFNESKLFLSNSFGFRELANEEMKKYNKKHFISLAGQMVKKIDANGFSGFSEPGIRAQLMDTKSSQLIQDFVVEGDEKSTHILNAVSPAFTCAFSFAHLITQKYLNIHP